MSLRWKRAARVVSSALVVTGLAGAQRVPRVALVTIDASGSTATQLRDELTELGVEVVIVAPPEGQPTGRAPLERVARGAGAFAAIRIVPSGAGVEVWVADRVTGKTVVREFIPGGSDDTVAVGAVELLRASLLEIHSARRAPRGEVEATPLVAQLAAPAASQVRPQPSGRAHGFSLALGPGIGWSSGGAPPAFLAQARAGYGSAGWIGVEALVGTGLGSTVRRSGYGSADLDPLVFAGTITLSAPRGTLVPVVAVGLGGVRLATQGFAEAPYATRKEVVWQGGGWVGAGVAWEASPQLRVRADLAALTALHAIRIRFAGDEVVRWGQPALLGWAGIEILVPRS
jgi:hypothetical protein